MAAPKTYKICVQDNPNFSISIKDGRVVILKKNDADFSQLWVKTDRTETDGDGRPTFVLVNRLTGQALTSPDSVNEKLTLETCNDSKAADVNNDILWAEHTKDEGYFYISTCDYSDRVIDASRPDAKTIVEGADIILFGQNDPASANQKWQLVPTYVTFGGEFRGSTQQF